ncbi:MAG: hypothetical protein IPN76_00750 [Saprospiraceae bacterium]|nr:hypothetical protein [Saprospiraceae bacterium]
MGKRQTPARLVAEHRCLLILDGLNPSKKVVVDTGKIQDPALFVGT